VLFDIEEVFVDIPVDDLPGRPRKKVQCHRCGKWIRDGREERRNGTVICRICAGGAYFLRFSKPNLSVDSRAPLATATSAGLPD
jgi:formylmethanofuran dehydrogenase subunit E